MTQRDSSCSIKNDVELVDISRYVSDTTLNYCMHKDGWGEATASTDVWDDVKLCRVTIW